MECTITHRKGRGVGGLQDLCQAKVSNLGKQPGLVQEDFAWFAIKPDNASAVQVDQPSCNTEGNKPTISVPPSLARRGLVSADVLAKIATRHELRHQEHLPNTANVKLAST